MPSLLGLQAEFVAHRDHVDEVLGRIVGMLEAKDGDKSPSLVEEAKQADGVFGKLPPQYEAVFAKYFDRNDGFSAEMDYLSRNSFAIFVPQKFSNATPAYLDFYKRDVRSKVLRGDNIADGIEEWCKLVARNLHYDRTKQTK